MSNITKITEPVFLEKHDGEHSENHQHGKFCDVCHGKKETRKTTVKKGGKPVKLNICQSCRNELTNY